MLASWLRQNLSSPQSHAHVLRNSLQLGRSEYGSLASFKGVKSWDVNLKGFCVLHWENEVRNLHFYLRFFVHRFLSLILRKTRRKTVFLLLRNIRCVSLLSFIWVHSTLLVFSTFITSTKVISHVKSPGWAASTSALYRCMLPLARFLLWSFFLQHWTICFYIPVKVPSHMLLNVV